MFTLLNLFKRFFTKSTKMNNSLTTIRPYKYNNVQWVFDDSSTGLNKEAFVAGVDTTLDQISKELNIDAKLSSKLKEIMDIKKIIIVCHSTDDERDYGWNYKSIVDSCLIFHYPQI